MALVVTVVLFLKHQERTQDLIREISTAFSQRIDSIQDVFRDQLRETHASFQAQTQKLTDEVTTVSKETALALRGLEVAVRELQLRDKADPPPPPAPLR